MAGHGFSEFADELRDFASDTEEFRSHTTQAIDRGMGTTAHKMARKARHRVPVDTGALKDTIRVIHVSPMVWEVRAGNRSDVDYALHVEYGTDPHPITPNGPYPLHFTVNGEEVYTHYVRHPGTGPANFFRSSFNETKELLKPNIMEELRRVAYYSY